jgi:alkylation response protein AidB-like acyl-CoA dehydrogenase
VNAARAADPTDEQRMLRDLARRFTDEQVIPQAAIHDREDTYPEDLVRRMSELGFLGATVPESYGGLGLDVTSYAMLVEELSRGWIAASGVMNTHLVGGYLLKRFGTEEQRRRFLPRMATGELRGAFALSEPHCGSDVQAIRTTATRDGSDYVVNGSKMWITSGLHAGVVLTLVRTDPDASPRHAGMSCLIVEKEPGAASNAGRWAGLDVGPKIRKLGYRGVETTELFFDGYRCPAENVLGGEEGIGAGFRQMMEALELGRVNVAARGVGVARRALELAIRYAQERHAFGKPISDHQGVSFRLADMATKVEAARELTYSAARRKDAGARIDLEAGMAKLYACEAAKDVVEDSMRIHGGYGYTSEYEIERLYRDVLLLVIGEGTSDIQRLVIAKRLLERRRS